MSDVAKKAGVCQSTVSLVLNNVPSARLSQPTQDRVRQAAKDLGYQLSVRNRPSTADMGNRNIIAYVADEISASPHPVVTIDGAREAAWDAGLMLSVFSTHNNAELEALTLGWVAANPSVAGVIYASIFTREIIFPAALKETPTVLLNCHVADRGHASVVPGELTGGYTATARLIQSGHRHIGYINGEPWMEAARDRLKGYRNALATADIPFDPSLVRDGDWLPDTGYAMTVELMAAPHPPTAIFCANDLMALGALEALHELGLRVPKDVAVIGYDDQEIARHTHPPLTTVLLPNFEMGRWAVETLVSQISGRDPPRSPKVKIECPLVERDSVGPIVVNGCEPLPAVEEKPAASRQKVRSV
jgi:LacI family transcriptional regulator